jgi:hypothetical protein
MLTSILALEHTAMMNGNAMNHDDAPVHVVIGAAVIA